jgi:hypothetical protein
MNRFLKIRDDLHSGRISQEEATRQIYLRLNWPKQPRDESSGRWVSKGVFKGPGYTIYARIV